MVKIGQRLLSAGFTSSAIDTLRSRRLASDSKLSEQYFPLLQSANKFISMDLETVSALYDIADAAVKGGYGVAKMASVAPNVTGVWRNINMTPGSRGKLIKNLDKLSKYTGFAKKAADCGFSILSYKII